MRRGSPQGNYGIGNRLFRNGGCSRRLDPLEFGGVVPWGELDQGRARHPCRFEGRGFANNLRSWTP